LWGPGGLARLIREVARCDAVHVHDALYLGNLVAALAAQRRRRPLLVTQHIGLVPYRNRLLRLLMAGATAVVTPRVLARCGQAVFTSRSVMEFFGRANYSRRPLFIPTGVDRARFRPADREQRSGARRSLGLAPDRPVVLFVGRFVEKKGLPLLRALAERHPDWTWAFVGSGPLDPGRWGLPQVRCAGAVPHERTATWYQAADLLVLPSVGEGFPLVVQEAMACGTPVVIPPETARALPGVEAVTLIADRSLEGLSRVLRRAVAAPAGLPELTAAAARFAPAHFDWDACADRYLDILDTLDVYRGLATIRGGEMVADPN
jgi:glycosyltransferase involved in cell wall biosynthesis